MAVCGEKPSRDDSPQFDRDGVIFNGTARDSGPDEDNQFLAIEREISPELKGGKKSRSSKSKQP